MRNYHQDGSVPMLGELFVFGSNLSGLHVGGAAQAAHQYHGAAWGVSLRKIKELTDSTFDQEVLQSHRLRYRRSQGCRRCAAVSRCARQLFAA